MGSMTSSPSVRRAAIALLLGSGCQGPPAAPAPRDDEDPATGQPEVTPPPASPDPVAVTAPAEPVPDREEAARLQAAFAAALGPEATLSFEALRARHAPAFLPAHGLDVRAAKHYEGFAEAFSLDAAERERLEALGFVVVPARGPGGAGPVDVYYRVFAADLPVFVSADSVLHAWHRSYDEILALTESSVLQGMLTEVLDGVHAALGSSDAAQHDARVYVSVARALLHDDRRVAPEDEAAVRPLLAAIDAERRAEVELLGQRRTHDFSQYRPRGHYAESEWLGRYFKAMMWLGRMDLRLYDPSTGASPNPREEAAARALVAALDQSGKLEGFEELERFYRLHVGRPNALTPADVERLCTAAGARTCRSAAAPAMAEQYQAQASPAYSSAPKPGVVSMRMLPQRFAYDAWVADRTTSPRLPAVGQSARSMASPYEVAFALGSERALEPLAAEMDEPYAAALPGRLEATRHTMEGLRPLELDETIYNHWLEALMVVGRTDLDERLPRVLRTAAWHDHRLETLLASWAELRHDTILVVEQSEGFIGCQYPQGYVEPLPELYRQLEQATAHLVAFYEGKDGQIPRAHLMRTVPAWAKHFRSTMERLARLSEQELRGEPMSAADLAFIDHTVDRHADDGYGGARSYDGWYAALYWNPGWQLEPRRERGLGGTYNHGRGGVSEPIVVDVHTDGDHDTVLEVATGHPELMIVVIDQGDDVAVYGGPASSFYAFEKPASQRMTDVQWEKAIQEHAAPSRPEFARGYRAR